MAPTRKELFNSLWDAFILEHDPRKDGPKLDRGQAALEHLYACQVLFERAREAGDEEKRYGAMGQGLAIWTLLSVEAASWLATAPGFPSGGLKPLRGAERRIAKAYLDIYEQVMPPTHRGSIDPVPLLLPRWLFTCIRDAFDALDKGEVHPLVEPVAGGRHDEPWTWDEMRARAVEHVAFMHGQGITLQIARQRVGTAMKVAPDTLRKWEAEPIFARRKEVAKAAGAHKATVDVDPGYCKGDGQAVDAHALALFLTLQEEPLASFGVRYRDRFGQRHHTPSGSGGD